MEADIPNDGYKINYQLLDKVEQNIIVLSMAGRSIIRLRQIIDL